jgi:hypothetical protein
MSCYLRTWPTLNLWAPVAPWRTRWFSFLFSFFPLFWTKKTRSFVRLQIYLQGSDKASPPLPHRSDNRPCVYQHPHHVPRSAFTHNLLTCMHGITYMRACMHALMIVGLSHQSTDVGQKFTAPFHNPIVHNLLSHPGIGLCHVTPRFLLNARNHCC